MVDLSKIKQDDEVTVRLYVTTINEHDVWLSTKAGNPAYMDAPVGLIVSHVPKAPVAGERVTWVAHTRHREDRCSGSVLSVDGNMAWIKTDPGDGIATHYTVDVRLLERVS